MKPIPLKTVAKPTAGSQQASDNQPAMPVRAFPRAGVPKTKSRVRKY